MKSSFFGFALGLLFACTLFFREPTLAQRVGHSADAWKTLRTENFDVIVSAEQQDLGLYYAQAAEKAYSQLRTIFPQLQARLIVVVNDTTDVTNGYATRIPYPHIMVFTAPAFEHDSLAEAGHWARELMVHELTHILQFEPASGFYTFLRPVFGTVVAPNLLMPLWWKEGMAVEMETRFSPRGRLRSTYQDAVLRSFVAEKKLENFDLAQANETLPSWPLGTRPYLFGSLLFSEIQKDSGKQQASGILTLRQSSRVPYFIEAPMHELLERSYETQYNLAMNSVREQAEQQLAQLLTAPLTPVTKKISSFSFQPRYSARHEILATVKSHKGKTKINFYDRQGKEIELKDNPTGQLTGFDFHPIEKKIIYSKIEKVDPAHNFSDLYIYDLDSDKSTQLTKSQRARNASWSEDGKNAVFVTTFAGQSQLRIINTETRIVSFILNSGFKDRYESPIFWNRQQLFAVKIDSDGRHHLVSVDIESRKETILTSDFTQIRFLRKQNSRLYFAATLNGVYNIYSTEDFQTAAAQTHLTTGTWSFTLASDEKKAWASVMTSEGLQVAEISLEPRTAPLPRIENAIGNRYRYVEEPTANLKYSASDYRAAPHLLPRYWIPFVSTSSSGQGLFLQATTSAHDPLNIHSYSLAASYDSELKRGNFNGFYLNSVWSLPWQVASTTQSRALGTVSDIVQTTTHSAAVLPSLFSLSQNLSLHLGAQLEQVRYTSDTQHWGPYLQVMYKDYEQNIYQISPETGWGALLKLEKLYKNHENVINTARDYERVTLTTIAFMSQFLPEQHALMIRYSGQLTFSSVLGRFGGSSSAAFIDSDGLTPQYVIRGYPNAQFFGRSISNINLEYRFPLTRIDRGSGSDAYFLKELSGAIVADGLSTEGSALTENQTYRAQRLNDSVWSAGAELRLGSTIGYILPIQFILGYYYPFSPLYASSPLLGTTLQLGGF